MNANKKDLSDWLESDPIRVNERLCAATFLDSLRLGVNYGSYS